MRVLTENNTIWCQCYDRCLIPETEVKNTFPQEVIQIQPLHSVISLKSLILVFFQPFYTVENTVAKYLKIPIYWRKDFFGYRFQMIQSMTIQAHVIDSDIKPTITTETEYLIKTFFFMPAWMVFHISTWKLYEEVQNKICIPGRQTPSYLFLLTSSVSEVSTFNNKSHINDCLHQQKTNLVISWTFEKMLNIKKKNSLTHA